MVDPGRSPRAVYLHMFTSRMRQRASRLLRILAFVLTAMLLAPLQVTGQQGERQNVELDWSNDPPLGGYSLGDFNGDGVTDLFRVVADPDVGNRWQYAAGGTGPWINLNGDPAPQSELRFGDFDGDGKTDVFHKDGNQWRFSSGGTEPWAVLATESVTPLNELRFGDFNGDGITDVFSVDTVTEPGRWRYSPGGTGGYVMLNIEPGLNVQDLRFGYFDSDDRIDIFNRQPNGQWRYSSGGASEWMSLGNGDASVPAQDMVLGDFDGDGISDVFNRQPSGQWRYSRSGTDEWTLLAMEPNVTLPNLRFGDFNGDGRTDVFSVAPDGRWRYSSGADSDWILLGPPAPPMADIALALSQPDLTDPPQAQPPQLAQPITTPAPTPAQTTECVEMVDNGDFEESGRGWTLVEGVAAPVYTEEVTFNDSGQAMRLGITEGENLASVSAIDQVIALPSEANSIILSFRYYPLYEPEPGPGDLQYVDIYNVLTGQFAGRALGTQSNERAWLTTDYDLTMQAGQNIRLVLAVNNDGVEGRSAMYVDNVSILACNFGDLVAPGDTPTRDPALGSRSLNDQTPILLAGRQEQTPSSWLARMSAIGVLASVAGIIGFAVMVVIGTLRPPD